MASRAGDDSEAGLVRRARDGDDGAFEELVRRRQGVVRGLFRRLARDESLADDLAQDTFLLAWRRLGQLREPGAFGGWLRRIAVSVWLGHVRRARLLEDPIDDDAEVAATPPARTIDRIDLDAALALLRPVERTCVVLSYAEGMTHAEIAQAMDLPLGTVKSHVSRASAKLRGWLASGEDARAGAV